MSNRTSTYKAGRMQWRALNQRLLNLEVYFKSSLTWLKNRRNRLKGSEVIDIFIETSENLVLEEIMKVSDLSI